MSLRTASSRASSLALRPSVSVRNTVARTASSSSSDSTSNKSSLAASSSSTLSKSSSNTKLRLFNSPYARSAAFVAASGLAGGLSLALYDRRDLFSLSNLGNSFSSSAKMPAQDYPLKKDEEDWKLQLSPEQFRILRKKGTEMAGTGEYDKHYPTAGVYNCAGCEAPLYNYDSKFKSGCGWPAFFEEIPGSVVRHTDSTFGMQRTEIVCANCGGHLGHVFKGEGFGHPKDERHCVNSVSLKYNKNPSE